MDAKKGCLGCVGLIVVGGALAGVIAVIAAVVVMLPMMQMREDVEQMLLEAEADAERANAEAEFATTKATADALLAEAEAKAQAEAEAEADTDATQGTADNPNPDEATPAQDAGTQRSGRRGSRRSGSADVSAPAGQADNTEPPDDGSIDGLDEAAELGARGGASEQPVLTDLDVAEVGPKKTSVRLKGNAEVFLIANGVRYELPGPVPPGKYQIEAAFLGEPPAMVGSIKVRKGKTMTLSCNDRLMSCKME